ncbi:uncharacterized protein [Paramisgurnus dabryanus]|uniref:uncharacterized protein isoform X2 n=1 Tax=Paramisgurnus dabryanus TaxID=90735 RepID=UPI0031F470BA
MSVHSSRNQIETLLIEAVNQTDARCVENLLCQGANPNAIIQEGVAAVHLAAGKESERGLRCLRLILQHGADPNLRTSEDLTPLHIAASWGCYQNLRLLLRNGGDPNLKDQDGNKPSDLAEQEENSKCASLLQEYEAHTSLEEHDAPKFQYSILSGPSMSDSTFSLEASSSCSESISVLDHPGVEPLSSTRLSNRLSERPLNRETQAFWLSETSDLESRDSHGWNKVLPILSSTSLSVLDSKSSAGALTAVNCDSNESQSSVKHPVQREERKSVSFRGCDDYFPVSSPDHHLHYLSLDQSSDLSEYSGFLGSECMATICQNQGIDVTYPDDVFVFSKVANTVEDEFEKTVVGPGLLDKTHDDDDDDDEEFKSTIQPPVSSGSSEYNSCDSNPYRSPTKNSVRSDVLSSTESNGHPPSSEVCSHKSDLPQGLCARDESQNCGRVMSESDRCHSEESHSSTADRDACRAGVTSAETDFIASPFVTGRTRSRQSRCSERMSMNSASFQSNCSIFEQTLPTPTRSQRSTAKSPYTPYKCSIDEEYDQVDDVDSRMSSMSLSSSFDSQADTRLLSDSMADTVLIPRSDADGHVEKHETFQTVCPEETTDDQAKLMTSKEAEETRRMVQMNSTALGGTKSGAKSGSLQESPEYTSRSSCESPESQKNVTRNPGQASGCTPRYSLSRLSGHTRRRTLADLSIIPGQLSYTDVSIEPVEYLYTDTEDGHELIETHVPVTANTSLCSSSTTNSDETLLYDWRSLKLTSPDRTKKRHGAKQQDDVEMSGLTDKDLRNKLIELGEDPGPINSQTRPLYVQKLKRSLQKSFREVLQSPATHSIGYGPELEKALVRFILPDCQADELALCQQFDQPDQNKRWREGLIKSSFNYLLLDPRVTMNLPYRSRSMSPKECFQTFISAVFYIGKGKRSRPYSHLYEALEYFKGDKTSKKLCSKVQHILQIWNSGHGVISLHCFQNVIAVEAYTREACMVDAIGLKMLTNQKRGDYYGVVSTWPVRKKRELGVHLLYRAMQIFLAEGERQLRPADIR